MKRTARRDFIKTSLMGGIAGAYLAGRNSLPFFENIESSPVNVSLISGDNRADLAFRALQPFSDQIRREIGSRRVVLKPNNVRVDVPLSSTHADTLEGILEFLKSINKLKNVIIAESPADAPAFEAYDNYGYLKFQSKYNVKFVDIDNEETKILYAVNQKDMSPHPVRVSRILTDPGSYIVSVARMKTHRGVMATLSLKNIILGAPVKDKGYRSNKEKTKAGTVSDKSIMHIGGENGLNYNIFSFAGVMQPGLALIDGFEGMEGNGPVNGTPVDHRVCVAGTDWLAADRVAVELMGIDFTRMPYLNYCARAGMGVAGLDKINVMGEKIADHIKHYKLTDNFESQKNLSNS